MKRSFSQIGINYLVLDDHENNPAININHEALISSSINNNGNNYPGKLDMWESSLLSFKARKDHVLKWSSSSSPPISTTSTTDQVLNKLVSSKITESNYRRADINDIDDDDDDCHFVSNGVFGTDHLLSSFNKVAMPSKSGTSSAHILNKVATAVRSAKAVKGALLELLGGCVAIDGLYHEANRSCATICESEVGNSSSTLYRCRFSTSSSLLNKTATTLALPNQSKNRVQEFSHFLCNFSDDGGGDGGGSNASVGIETTSTTTSNFKNEPSMSESIIGVSSTSCSG